MTTITITTTITINVSKYQINSIQKKSYFNSKAEVLIKSPV